MNRKCNRAMAIFCVFSVLFSLAFSVSAKGEQWNFVIEQVGSCKAGEQVRVTTRACAPLPSVSSLEMEFTYDTTYLELMLSDETGTYFEFGDSCKGFMGLGYQETMRVALISLETTLKPGNLVTLVFLVKEAIPEGYLAQVTAKVTSAYDANGNALSLTCSDGGVLGQKEPPPEEQPNEEQPSEPPVVTPADTPSDLPTETEKIPYGDLNQDQKIDAKDALMILKYLVDKGDLTLYQRMVGEVSGDGGLTAKDALEILRYSVNKIQKFPVEP